MNLFFLKNQNNYWKCNFFELMNKILKTLINYFKTRTFFETWNFFKMRTFFLNLWKKLKNPNNSWKTQKKLKTLFFLMQTYFWSVHCSRSMVSRDGWANSLTQRSLNRIFHRSHTCWARSCFLKRRASCSCSPALQACPKKAWPPNHKNGLPLGLSPCVACGLIFKNCSRF